VPYRKHESDAAREHVDDGIVGELVQQFADPYAFYRELVQNAIDAGTSQVKVLVRPRASGGVRVSVRDDGEGMNPEVLENKLLVLFRSGKEGRTDAIGKFGVGFVSVLALHPEKVTVETSRGEGAVWTMHLFSDHRYDLFEVSRTAPPGTTVSLDLPALDASEFIERSKASLRAWCRHAAIPIWFQIAQGVLQKEEGKEEGQDADGDVDLDQSRIDEPIGLPECLAQVDMTVGTTRIVLGVPKDPTGYAGFFNHGLTLFETTLQDPALIPTGALHFKVQDIRLEHTLSRDNVRRDAAFSDVLRKVRDVYEDHLVPAVLSTMRRALEAGDDHRYAGLLARVLHPSAPLSIPVSRLPVRLLHRGSGVVARKELARGAIGSAYETALSHALAERGVQVVDAGPGRGLARGPTQYLTELDLEDARTTYTLVVPMPTPPDHALVLLDRLAALFAASWRAPAGIQLVAFHGAHANRLLGGGKVDGAPWVTEGTLDANPFRLLRRPGLLLNVTHAAVTRALALAEDDALLAATLLAREVALDREDLDDGLDEAMTEWALTEALTSRAPS
jgi:molecular chaperone HtpG